MSDEITQAPRVPQPTAAPGPAHATEAHNFSRPATAHAASPTATNTAPVTSPASTAIPPTTAQHATTAEHHTLNEKLNNSDRYWKFKTGLHILAIVFGLIGIGTIGWCVSTMSGTDYSDSMNYGYDQYWTLWPTLITFSVSIIWSIICIAVFVLRARAVHPGLRVAMELLLWLGFLVTALFAMVALVEIFSWGTGGNLGYSSSYGDYVFANNGTWVWQQDARYTDPDSTYYSSTSYQRPCNRTSSSSSSYYSSNGFRNCADQDAYVNKLWQEKPHRQNVELTGIVMQFFGLLLHFALFVWACVDCHRYNRTKTNKDAEKIAAGIVQTMITNGAVVPPPGQAHMRPAWAQPQMGYYQLPPQQGYPMANVYPQQMPPNQPGASQQFYGSQHPGGPSTGPAASPAARSVSGLSNEKSEGPRYA